MDNNNNNRLNGTEYFSLYQIIYIVTFIKQCYFNNT